MDALQRLLDFLDMLQARNVTYSLHHYAPDSVTVLFTLVGVRVEAYFAVDGMTFSIFKGNEAVEDTKELLDELFREHWDEPRN